MTNPQSTLEAVVWVAIDVAKDRHEALIEAPGWKNRKKFRVQNTAEEFRAFADFCMAWARPLELGLSQLATTIERLPISCIPKGFSLELISSVARSTHPRSHAQLVG